MFCTKCGKEVNDNAYICPHCGELLTHETTNQSVQPARNDAKLAKTFGILSTVFAGIVFLLFLFVPYQFKIADSGIGILYNVTCWLMEIASVVLGGIGTYKSKKSGSVNLLCVIGLAASATMLLLL